MNNYWLCDVMEGRLLSARGRLVAAVMKDECLREFSV